MLYQDNIVNLLGLKDVIVKKIVSSEDSVCNLVPRLLYDVYKPHRYLVKTRSTFFSASGVDSASSIWHNLSWKQKRRPAKPFSARSRAPFPGNIHLVPYCIFNRYFWFSTFVLWCRRKTFRQVTYSFIIPDNIHTSSGFSQQKKDELLHLLAQCYIGLLLSFVISVTFLW